MKILTFNAPVTLLLDEQTILCCNQRICHNLIQEGIATLAKNQSGVVHANWLEA